MAAKLKAKDNADQVIGKIYNKEIKKLDWSGCYPVINSEGVITEVILDDSIVEKAEQEQEQEQETE